MSIVNAVTLSATSNEIWSGITVTLWGGLTCLFTMDIHMTLFYKCLFCNSLDALEAFSEKTFFKLLEIQTPHQADHFSQSAPSKSSNRTTILHLSLQRGNDFFLLTLYSFITEECYHLHYS